MGESPPEKLRKRDSRRELSEAIGSVFRSARELQRLSQDELVALTERAATRVSRGTISDIERGRSLPGLEVLVSLSSVLNIEPNEVLERIRIAKVVPVDVTGMTLDDLRQKAEHSYWTGDYRSALAVCDAMVERIALEPPEDEGEKRRLLAKLEIRRALALRRCSALKASETSAKRAVQWADGSPELQAEAYMVLASIESHENLPALALVAADEAVRLAAVQATNTKLQGQAWDQKGNVLHRAGRYREARDAFLHAHKLLSASGDFRTLLNVEGNIGSCLIELGQVAQGARRLVKAVELACKHHDRAKEASWLVELGRVRLRLGELDDAEAHGRAALKIAKPAEQTLTVFRGEWLLHLVKQARAPGAKDRHRIAHLTKLYPHVKEHKTTDAVREFEETILGVAGGPRGGT